MTALDQSIALAILHLRSRAILEQVAQAITRKEDKS